jgi:hypothetical protein
MLVKDSTQAEIIGLIGAICVALISGVISVLGLIISKEQKLSDFRQAWIDALRDDISHFVSFPITICAYWTLIVKPKAMTTSSQALSTEFYAETKDSYANLNIYSTRIKLRLNTGRHEVDSNILLQKMEEMENLLHDFSSLDDVAVLKTVKEIQEASRPLLKKEWERVKNGERSFQFAKYASFIVSALILLFLGFACVRVPALFPANTAKAKPAPDSAEKVTNAASAHQDVRQPQSQPEQPSGK